MGVPHPLIPADQSGQRDRLWGGEGRIPACPVFHRHRGRPIGGGVFLSGAMLHQLLPGLRMLALCQQRKVLGAYGTGKAVLFCEPPLPLALHGPVLFVVALRFGRELHPVIRLRLAGTEGLGNREHGVLTADGCGLSGRALRSEGHDLEQSQLPFRVWR